MDQSDLPQALLGLRVVELCCYDSMPYFAAAIAGKVMADLGAEVVKVEPPGGSAERRRGPFRNNVHDIEAGGLHIYLNANKLGVETDLDDPAQRGMLSRLLASADILLNPNIPAFNASHELDWPALRQRFPRLVVVSMPFFPAYSDYRNLRGGNLIAAHMSNVGWMTRAIQVTDPPNEPPLKPGGMQSDVQTGFTAAAAAMAAILHRQRHGLGQHVETDQLLATISQARPEVGVLTHESPETVPYQRLFVRGKTILASIFRCRDGWMSLSGTGDRQWPRLKEMVGNPQSLEGDAFSTMLGRMQNGAVIEQALVSWMAQHTRQEVFDIAQSQHLPCFPVYEPAEVARNVQYRERGFFIEHDHPAAGRFVMPGAPYILSRTPWRIYRPAPRLGEHNRMIFEENSESNVSGNLTSDVDAHEGAAISRRDRVEPVASSSTSVKAGQGLPLEGVRVLDFGWIYSIPHATAWLGALGAEVVRVESTNSIDMVRRGSGTDGVPGPNRSGGFNAINICKESIVLNLRSAEGFAIATDLARQSDIVLENFAVGTMKKFGLGFEALRAIKPDLIMISCTCLGQTGPLARTVGYGPNVQAFAGMAYLTQIPGIGSPAGLIGGTYPDFLAGVAMTFVALAALRHRNRTGEGQYVDLSMGEMVTAALPEVMMDFFLNGREAGPTGNRDEFMAPHNVFPTAGSDRWIAIAIASDAEFASLCEALGDHALAVDSRFRAASGRLAHVDELERRIAALTANLDRDALVAKLRGYNLAVGPVNNIREVFNDPVVSSSGMMVPLAHSECGERVVPGLPVRFSRFDLRYRATPCIGEHTEQVLMRRLGYTAADIERLNANNVLV